MKKLKLVLLFLILSATATYAANIVYPSSNNATITAPTTFFIGNENPKSELTINGEKVKVHKSGGFLHPVDLEYGINTFEISNKDERKIYKITRPKIDKTIKKYSPITYKKPILFVTSTDSVPLRATPYASGLNRLQNLQKDIPLTIVGEFNEFYKVQLARDDFAWVAKSRVKKATFQDFSQAGIISISEDELPDKYTYKIKLSKKVPFTFDPTTIYETNSKQTHYHERVKDYHLTIFNVNGYPENKFEYLIDRKTPPFGYKASYNKNDLIIEIKKAPIIDKRHPLKGIKVMVDPGHGGYENGTTGCLGHREKDINLAIAQKLKNHLQKAGAIVIMSRVKDVPLGLSERVLSAQENNVDIFISVHNNALPDSAAYSKRIGASTYYYNLHSHELAEFIQDRLVNELGMNNDKVRRESFAVIRNPQTIAVLVEVGYLIKPEDNAKLVNSKFQDKAAIAIMHGLENYLNDLYE